MENQHWLNPGGLGARGRWRTTWVRGWAGRPRSWTPPAPPGRARGQRRLSASRPPWEGQSGWTGLWRGTQWIQGCCTCESLGQSSLFLSRRPSSGVSSLLWRRWSSPASGRTSGPARPVLCRGKGWNLRRLRQPQNCGSEAGTTERQVKGRRKIRTGVQG